MADAIREEDVAAVLTTRLEHLGFERREGSGRGHFKPSVTWIPPENADALISERVEGLSSSLNELVTELYS